MSHNLIYLVPERELHAVTKRGERNVPYDVLVIKWHKDDASLALQQTMTFSAYGCAPRSG